MIDGIMDLPRMTFSFIIGTMMGLVYFYGLWWTLRRLPRVRRPGGWLAVSAVLRAAACLSLFYLLLRDSWVGMVMAVIGFFFGRYWVIRRVRLSSKSGALVVQIKRR